MRNGRPRSPIRVCRKKTGFPSHTRTATASAANSGEINEGRLAERKATNPAVKAFARQMVADHSAMLTEGKSFASKNNIRPDTTKDDVTDLKKDSRDLVKDLTGKKAGKDWDEDYIEHEIDGHKKVLDKLQDAEKSTTDPQLKTMLTKAVSKVQEHLTKAEDIKDNKIKS
jgi:putative membrane protein